MKKRFSIFLAFSAAITFNFLFFSISLARTDLSLTATDIAFSKEEALNGETIRVFARVFNLGDTDVYGFVVFSDNGKEMADPQPISVKANTYDDVFIDWQALAGQHDVQARIVAPSLADENTDNDTSNSCGHVVATKNHLIN